jgi:hypothetical protein
MLQNLPLFLNTFPSTQMRFCHLVTFRNNEEVEMTLRECLRIQDSDFYLN